ncbi:MAG TPA: JAB domain-containing protein [Verrucomicrobiae bacterium]|nr:JAB domain-containing protein [Verrucomicrobiae bacterium]
MNNVRLPVDGMLPHLKFIRNKQQEYLICISLNSVDKIIARHVVTIGLLNATMIHPREIFGRCLEDRAASVVVAHNHPSGDPIPSDGDIVATQQLVAAGIVIGIPVRDHIIVTRKEYYSFYDRRML